MIDYTLDQNDKKDFILYFKELGDKIICYYADGSHNTFRNDEFKKDSLLAQLRKQCENSVGAYNSFARDYRSDLLLLCMNLSSGFIQCFSTRSNAGTTIALSGLLSILFLHRYILNNKIFKDIDKNRTYLEYEKLFNEYLFNNYRKPGTNENITLLDGVSKKCRSSITRNALVVETKPYIDINMIHGISYRDIDIMKTNAEEIKKEQIADEVQKRMLQKK